MKNDADNLKYRMIRELHHTIRYIGSADISVECWTIESECIETYPIYEGTELRLKPRVKKIPVVLHNFLQVP